MELKICKNCRRLFNYIYGPELCQECTKLVPEGVELLKKELSATINPQVRADEEEFDKIKSYIMANPKATILQISEENDITPAKLFDWIREDRLEFSDDSQNAWFTCEKCGMKIKSGRLCSHCKIAENIK